MRLLIGVALLACVGCASRPAPQVQVLVGEYEDAPAMALAFDPPAASDIPPVDLWRDSRAASAFVAYDELTTTFFYIRTYDRFTTDGTDRYVRKAIIEKAGVSYR